MAALVYYGFRMTSDDVLYDCLPLYHSAGNNLLLPFSYGKKEIQRLFLLLTGWMSAYTCLLCLECQASLVSAFIMKGPGMVTAQ